MSVQSPELGCSAYSTEENTLRLYICISEKVVITFVPVVTVSFTVPVKCEWDRVEVQYAWEWTF